jgi:hypothetical protein
MVDQNTPVFPETVKSLIPHGVYCYEYKNGEQYTCPFWEKIIGNDGEGYYEAGYCHYLKMEDSITLWDMLKECGENEGLEDEDWCCGI